MRRNGLRLYMPPEELPADQTELSETDRHHVLRFRQRSRATVISGRLTHPADRARVIRENRACPECDLTNVEPLELGDGLISPANHQPIPGTATIVGFHCNHCGTEWPVYDLATRRNA